ncbi:MAG: T9SS type A sorting domain-containing protein [Bacteroidales bacterium]|nr:T9SS type A sorting domain-containing protein [Bacteroidales bacterium]
MKHLLQTTTLSIIFFHIVSTAIGQPLSFHQWNYKCADECLVDKYIETDNICGNTSSLLSDTNFFMIDSLTMEKIVRINFIFVQRDDSSGNFQPNNAEHQLVFDSIVACMNYNLSHLNIASCGGTIVDSKIRFEASYIYIQDTYLWNNDHDSSSYYKCPNRTNWYLLDKAHEIDNDDNIPKGIDVFFTNGLTAYNYNVVNNGMDLQAFNYACSLSPSSNYDDGSYVHMPDLYIKFYWMRQWGSYLFDQQWSVIRGWFIHSTAGGILHELGHSFGLSHQFVCDRNIINPNGSSARDYLNDNQIYKMHKSIARTNIRKFVKEVNSLDAPFIVTGEKLIDFNTRLYRDIYVESGGELTISCEVLMPALGKIAVKQGGQLHIDGGTVTNSDSLLWQGIQVWGHSDSTQEAINNLYYQGRVDIINNSLIEKAMVALNLWNPSDSTTTGGIAVAENSTFRNNAKSLNARNYSNFSPYNPSQTLYNKCSFRNCVFEITQDYPVDTQFNEHIELLNFNGAGFHGCDFLLSDSASNITSSNRGILSNDSHFSVLGYCNSETQPCPEDSLDKSSFSGFYNAIYANSTGLTTRSFMVKNTIFNNNGYAIESENINFCAINFCDFNLGYCSSCEEGVGIHIENGMGFSIEENTFQKFSTSSPSSINYYGIHISNSEYYNEIYKNSFNGMTYANYASGQNYSSNSPALGLEYLCNTNQSNKTADFYVANPISPNTISGIKSSMGSIDIAAGNTFSYGGRLPIHFYNGGSNNLIYFYNQNIGIQTPLTNNIYGVTSQGININNSCLSHFDDKVDLFNLPLTYINKLQNDYYYNYYNFINLKNELDNRLSDEGVSNSTSNKKEKADNYKNQYMHALYALLRGYINNNIKDYEAIRTWIAKIGDGKANQLIIASLIEQKNYDKAIELASEISYSKDINTEKHDDYDNLIQLLNFYKSKKSTTFYSLNDGNFSFINDYEQNSLIDNLITTYSRIAMKDYTIKCTNNTRTNKKNSTTEHIVDKVIIINALPNPANDHIVFNYNNVTTPCFLTVKNINGNTIFKSRLSEDTGQIIWHTADIANGIYIYSIISPTATLKSDKLIIQH